MVTGVFPSPPFFFFFFFLLFSIRGVIFIAHRVHSALLAFSPLLVDSHGIFSNSRSLCSYRRVLSYLVPGTYFVAVCKYVLGLKMAITRLHHTALMLEALRLSTVHIRRRRLMSGDVYYRITAYFK